MADPVLDQQPPAPTYTVTHFNNVRELKGRCVDLTWLEFVSNFERQPFAFRGVQDHFGWSPATYEDDSRAAPTKVVQVSMLTLDWDADSEADLSTPYEIFPGLAFLAHTTKKSTPRIPRFRTVHPLSRPVTPDEYAKLWSSFVRRVTASGYKVDEVTKDPGRFWYSPSLPAEGDYMVRSQPGACIDVDALLAEWIDDDVPASAGRRSRPSSKASGVGGDTVLGRAFGEMGWVYRILPNGALAVRCPNCAAHTSGDPTDANDTGTVIFPSTSKSGLGGFHCSHSHCAELKTLDVLKLLPADVLKRAGWTLDKGNAAAGQQRDGIAHAVVELAMAHCVLFHTKNNGAFALVEPDEQREVMRIRGDRFRALLGRLAYEELGKVCNGNAMNDACAVLEAEALYKGECREIHVRLAEHEGRIYIDLGTGRDVVCVSTEGWRVVTDCPVLFYRPDGLLALPVPTYGGSIELLRPYLNCDYVTFQLIVEVVVSWFRPRGPYLVLVLTGEQGCGKSTTARVIKLLIDPGVAALRALSRNVQDLMIAGQASWLLVFDNLSKIGDEMSDALSRVSTGGGFATRQLYSDDGQILFDLVRPLLLNGIDESFGRADLQDRSVTVVLPVIPDDARRDEETYWRDFKVDHPQIFGALLDAVVMALRRFPEVNLPRKPRMADAARWITAAEPALGWNEGTFLAAFADNQREAARVGVDGDVIAGAVAEVLGGKPSWSGTATTLLVELAAAAPMATGTARDFPKTPAALGTRLRRAAPHLRRMGIEVVFARQGSNGARIIEVRRQGVSAVRDIAASSSPPLGTTQGKAEAPAENTEHEAVGLEGEDEYEIEDGYAGDDEADLDEYMLSFDDQDADSTDD